MISHRLRSYAFDISNRWMNNAEKKMKMMRRNGENDMWLLIIFCELFWDTVLLLLIHFIEVFAFERRASWSISRQKGAHLFFGNFPGQKRSFFPHSLLFTSSCVSVLVFFSSASFAVDATLERSLFHFVLCFVFCKGFFLFRFLCRIRMHLDHKGSCWCMGSSLDVYESNSVRVVFSSLRFFSLVFSLHLPSPCRYLLCINIDGIIRCEMLKLCAWLYYVRTKRPSKTITDDLRFSCFISKMIFINFGFFLSLSS